jgi:hypothetical protein
VGAVPIKLFANMYLFDACFLLGDSPASVV